MTDEKPEPICVGCNILAKDHPEYIEMGEVEGMDPEEYVRREEGTYNRENGHFLCTGCYVKAGMPSGPRGWTCP